SPRAAPWSSFSVGAPGTVASAGTAIYELAAGRAIHLRLTAWLTAARACVIVALGAACGHAVALTSRVGLPYKPRGLRSASSTDKAWLFRLMRAALASFIIWQPPGQAEKDRKDARP